MSDELRGKQHVTLGTDDLGRVARVLIDASVYSKTAIFKTTYWYTDRCYLFLSKPADHPDSIEVEVRPKNEMPQEDLTTLCREFCNSLIDYQVRQVVIAETGSVRDALVKKAFFEGSHRKPSELRSDETRIPEKGQSYKTDPLKIGRTTGS